MAEFHAERWLEGERRRLISLCGSLSGDRCAAEDLAQETLLEAWRSLDKLHDPKGADRWISAIARNVCLRWERRRGRSVPLAAFEHALEAADPFDLELDLERSELAALLDRALAALPAPTRDAVVQRYLLDSPHAEIAARLGVSTDALSMRLTRGKLVLRTLLAPELAGGEPETPWTATRIWCAQCGGKKLLVQHTAAEAIRFRCPACDPDSLSVELSLTNPSFARLVAQLARPSAILARLAAWSTHYYGGGAGAVVPCTRCGARTRLRPFSRPSSGPGASARGLAAECDACGERTSSSLGGLALARPEVRRLRAREPRLRGLCEREVETDGTRALLVRYEAVSGAGAVDVLFGKHDLRVIDVRTAA